MRLIFKVSAMALIALSATKAESRASEDRVRKLLDYKQAKFLFATPFADLKAALDRRKKYTEITEEQSNKILSVGEKIYKQDNIYDVFVAAYALFANPRQVEAEIGMFESKVGQMYQKALAEMAAPDFSSRVFRYWQTRDLVKIEQNRKNVIGSYIKQTKIAEATGVLHAGMDISIDLALNSFTIRRNRQTLETIKRDTRLRKNNYIMSNADPLIQGVTFAFREMKNVQIDWITRFYFTRAGEQSSEAYGKAIEATLDRAGETLMHNLNPDTKKPPVSEPTLAKPKPKAKAKNSP